MTDERTAARAREWTHQLKKDTPWMLVDGDDNILATGTAGFPVSYVGDRIIEEVV